MGGEERADAETRSRSPRLIRVGADEAGRRLDVILAARVPGLARAKLKRLILAGEVAVNGGRERPSYLVRRGDAVSLRIPPEPRAEEPQPEKIPLAVVYEDEDILVLDKPAGMVVHPSDTVRAGTLVNALLGRGGPLSRVGDPSRPGIVHRLDKGTSGLMLVARRDDAHVALVRLLRERRIRRTYWALVWGRPKPAAGTLVGAVGRDTRRRTRMAVRTVGGKEATTHYETIRSFGWASELSLRLETGRTHQIRVHLAHCGHPVFGDSTYGGRRCPAGLAARERRLARSLLEEISRPALHAAELAFVHPANGRQMRFSSPLPADLGAIVAVLAGREEAWK